MSVPLSMPPSLFISHGAPSILLGNVPVRRYLASLGARIRPTSILLVSAHFGRDVPTLALPVHEHANKGDAVLCREASALLSRSNIAHDVMTVDAHGHDLEHSAWLPLRLMFPDLDASIALLSLRDGGSSVEHHALGRALSPLREKGVLVIGSGSLTHNHDEINALASPETPTTWARAFVSWMADRVEDDDVGALMDYRRRAPHAERSHPTEEHLLPLFVAMGAAVGARGRLAHDGFVFGTISLGAFEFQ